MPGRKKKENKECSLFLNRVPSPSLLSNSRLIQKSRSPPRLFGPHVDENQLRNGNFRKQNSKKKKELLPYHLTLLSSEIRFQDLPLHFCTQSKNTSMPLWHGTIHCEFVTTEEAGTKRYWTTANMELNFDSSGNDDTCFSFLYKVVHQVVKYILLRVAFKYKEAIL